MRSVAKLGLAIVLTVIDRYVLRQISTPLLASLGIGLLVLLAERLVRLLDVTLWARRIPLASFSSLLAYLVPHYLGTAVPAALVFRPALSASTSFPKITRSMA